MKSITAHKYIAERRHAERRAFERFGIVLSKAMRQAIINQIQTNGVYAFLDKQSLRVSRYLMKIHGQWAVVVYDRMRKEIVTMITEEMWVRGQEEEDWES